ncbi:MAG: ABC transporter ATP-binding protein [Pseudomonadota bacterium]|jgi:ABC-2 type transport system ATP-binding protein
MTSVISARGLAKNYGATQALKPSDLDIPLGRIVGVVGANGAGKTTLLNCFLGLLAYDGALSVLGREPYRERARLMHEVSYIADVATLPRWMKVHQLLDFVAGVHPRFDKNACARHLARTKIRPEARVRTLSKGMVAQLHLAIVMAIDARLLVLDEPTLGLDILFRKSFYDALISDYFDDSRTIIVSTHQVEEIEQILTHVIFIKDGEIVLDAAMDEVTERVLAVEVAADKLAAAEALRPIHRRTGLGRTTLIFDGQPAEALSQFGAVRRLGLADIFIAKMQG